MANVITPTFSFTLPEVGADTNAWGGHLNGNFTIIDNNMLSRTSVAAQTMAGILNLPANGLNVGSGQLQVTGGNISISGSVTAVGGTFSSVITASTAPTLGGHLANKTYVDAQTALRLPLTGGTLTGLLTLSGAPTAALHAATKTYVDNAVTGGGGYLVNAGTGLSGGGTISSNPTLNIAAGGVGTTQIAATAVTTAKIANAAVGPAQMSQPFTSIGSATTSGAAVNFTGIPSWAKRITVMLDTVLPAADIPMIQIGPSGGLDASANYSYYVVSANGGSVSKSDTGIGFSLTGSSGSQPITGHVVLTLLGANVWVISGMVGGNAINNVLVITGRKTLSGALALLTIKTLFGGGFTSGSVNVFYE